MSTGLYFQYVLNFLLCVAAIEMLCKGSNLRHYILSMHKCTQRPNYIGLRTIGLDLAKWLARLTANAKVATVHGFNHSILRHRRT